MLIWTYSHDFFVIFVFKFIYFDKVSHDNWVILVLFFLNLFNHITQLS